MGGWTDNIASLKYEVGFATAPNLVTDLDGSKESGKKRDCRTHSFEVANGLLQLHATNLVDNKSQKLEIELFFLHFKNKLLIFALCYNTSSCPSNKLRGKKKKKKRLGKNIVHGSNNLATQLQTSHSLIMRAETCKIPKTPQVQCTLTKLFAKKTKKDYLETTKLFAYNKKTKKDYLKSISLYQHQNPSKFNVSTLNSISYVKTYHSSTATSLKKRKKGISLHRKITNHGRG